MSSCDDILKSLLDILKQRYEVDSTSNQFNALPPNKKVSFAYRLLEDNALLPARKKSSPKCATEAINHRTQGNKAFLRKKDSEALDLYSRSVCVSAPNSSELSIAYANRSAVLFKLEMFDLCVLDIDRALSINYPDNLKYKLHERRGKCLKEMGRCCEAKQSFQNAQKYLSSADLTPQQRNTWETSLNQLIDEYAESDQSCNEVNSVNHFILPALSSKNSLIPNASDKIQLNSSLEMGRHMIASQDIGPGELLAVEKPFASILLPEYYNSHCSNCFVRNPAMIPCEKCSLVMFCNEKCRTESMTRYHATECDILAFLLSLDVSKMELLSVRILIMATNQGKDLNILFEDPIYGSPLPYPIPSDLLNVGDVYLSENYETVHMLEENFFKRPPTDLFQRSVASALLLNVIKFSPFFENALSKSTCGTLKDFEEFTGSLLLKYLCVVLCNAHEISEIIQNTVKPRTKLGNRSLEIGAALYPLLSLINHSCDPNVVRHSYHDGVVLRAIQPIAKDQQIFDNYGYHYAVHDLRKRQQQLKLQYFFACSCPACIYDWPMYKSLPSKNPRYIPTRVPVEKLNELSKKFRKTLLKIMDSEMDGILEGLCEYLSLLHKYILRPWKEYSECQEAIKECLACHGNYYVNNSSFVWKLDVQTDH